MVPSSIKLVVRHLNDLETVRVNLCLGSKPRFSYRVCSWTNWFNYDKRNFWTNDCMFSQHFRYMERVSLECHSRSSHLFLEFIFHILKVQHTLERAFGYVYFQFSFIGTTSCVSSSEVRITYLRIPYSKPQISKLLTKLASPNLRIKLPGSWILTKNLVGCPSKAFLQQFHISLTLCIHNHKLLVSIHDLPSLTPSHTKQYHPSIL